MIKVYPSSPIRGLSYIEATAWRDYITKKLSPEITVYSPMRGKECLLDSLEIDERNFVDDPLFEAKTIVASDFGDIRDCDLMLVNLLGATHLSVGTIGEIGGAHMLHKRIVLVMEKSGNVHDHPFVTEPAMAWLDDLDQAIVFVKRTLLP